MYKTINLDVDGVLADFNGRFIELTGKTFEDFPCAIDAWNALGKYKDNLYIDLNILDNAQTLVEEVINIANRNNYQVSVLTALPKINVIPNAEEHKRWWIKKYFPKLIDRFKIGPHSEDKWKHCYSKYDILIDDYWKNTTQWEKVGGKSILYNSKNELSLTLNTLRSII